MPPCYYYKRGLECRNVHVTSIAAATATAVVMAGTERGACDAWAGGSREVSSPLVAGVTKNNSSNRISGMTSCRPPTTAPPLGATMRGVYQRDVNKRRRFSRPTSTQDAVLAAQRVQATGRTAGRHAILVRARAAASVHC